MLRAIGFAALIIVMAIFLPKVLHSMETFVITFFEVATNILGEVQNLEIRQ